MTDVVAAGLPTHRVYVSHLTDRELVTAAASASRTTSSARGSAPSCGSATAAPCRCARRCSTCTRSSAATSSATAAAPPRRPATSSSSPAAPPTASAWRHPPAVPPSRTGRPASPRVVWTRPASSARRSPIDGKQRLFAEPPHMQASMLFLPHGAEVPAIGDEVDVRVRFTATALRRDRRLLTTYVVERADTERSGTSTGTARPVHPTTDLPGLARWRRGIHRVVGEPVGPHRVVPGQQDVADHHARQPQLRGDPDEDRPPVGVVVLRHWPPRP